MDPATAAADIPPDLQAEAEAYQVEYTTLRAALREIEVNLGHNRQRGFKLAARMRACGVANLVVGTVLLRLHRDDRGFERVQLSGPARSPHA